MALEPKLTEILDQMRADMPDSTGETVRAEIGEVGDAAGGTKNALGEIAHGLREMLPQVIEAVGNAARDATEALHDAEADDAELIEVQPALRDLPQEPVEVEILVDDGDDSGAHTDD